MTNRTQTLCTLLWLGTLLHVGCDSESKPAADPPIATIDASETTAEGKGTPEPENVDHLAVARRMASLNYWESSADAAYKALLEDPTNYEAMLLAGEAEAERGNFDKSLALASSIDTDWRLGERAVFLHARSLFELKRTSEAADVFLAELEKKPRQSALRHRAWRLLNQVGRREDACRQAELLCRIGQADEMELHSLIRRTDAFPIILEPNTDPSKYFEPGLGLARWHFSQLDYRKAIEELTPEYESGFKTAAASALYGRLLAETQAAEQFPKWHAACDLPELEELGDYWAALGTHFFDAREYEASARALLEAVLHNPTDRLSIQRLAKVFDAMGQPEQAEQFRRRGVELAQCERSSEALQAIPVSNRSEHQSGSSKLMQHMLELERPFEILAWAIRVHPSRDIQKRREIEQKRGELLNSEEALVMAREASLLGVDPNNFSLGTAFETLLAARETPPSPPESKLVTALAAPRLVNVASNVGLDFQWYQDLEINLASIPIHESIGGGIAVLDYDLDGWPDVYFAQGSGEPPSDACTRSNQLMRNNDGKFVAVTLPAGGTDLNYGSGLAAGDVNQDGFPDLFVGSLGHNRLLINNGDGTFQDTTERLGEVADRFSTSLAIADINGDALPDLYEAVYIEMDGAFALPKVDKDGREIQPSPLEHFAQSDRWFENLGNGNFAVHEITRDTARPGTSLGVLVADFDNQSGNEVFVGNDVRPNHFLLQADENTLLNAADVQGVANGFSGTANGCMGIAAADFNHDGTLDLHITNFNQESANLYLQATTGGFTDYAVRYRLDELSLPYVGFGTKAIDIDRNGWLDLAITNGHIFDMSDYGEGFQLPPQLLMNRGEFFELVAVDDDSGYWEQNYLGRSMAMLDFDRDGASDLMINHLDKPVALLRNETNTKGRELQLELVGTTSERDAIGTRVEIAVAGQKRTAWVTAGDGYLCSDEAFVEFGLGLEAEVTRLVVHWPSGKRQEFTGATPPGRYLAVEGQTDLVSR
ncbi:MAG: FG-GAP-like repeat-containing protein [Rubripirellula sp.]